jgi:hypothetical protein
VDQFDRNPIYGNADCAHAEDGNRRAIDHHDKFAMHGSVCEEIFLLAKKRSVAPESAIQI